MATNEAGLQEWLDAWADPELAAQLAGLRYVLDDAPGIQRKRHGQGFTYFDTDGERIPAGDERRKRFDALVIPPAWTDVWICPDHNGHLLVTGRDEKGRKQYIYHPDWQSLRNEAKFNRLLPFGEALGQIRARCTHDLGLPELPRDKVLALVVTLLDQTLIRVGNQAYAQDNGSFGLTTLRDRHVDFLDQGCIFKFVGKSGKEHCVSFDDPELAALVRECRDVTGYHLFQYLDDGGHRGEVHSTDVNAYLKETTGAAFTAKDFRTWGGTVHAASVLAALEPCDDERTAEKCVVDMVRSVAERLGNTPAVCRAYYIHSGIIDAYLTGELHGAWARLRRLKPLPQLDHDESTLLHFLRERLG